MAKPTRTVAKRSDHITRDEIREMMHQEFRYFLDDIEYRLKQTYEVANRAVGAASRVYTEDLSLHQHMITGYTVSCAAGTITWTSVNIVYNGTNYAMTNGTSANTYVWFDAAVSTTVLQNSNVKPTLAGNACLVFVKTSATTVSSVLESSGSSLPVVVADGAVDTGAIQATAITAAKIANNTITSTQISGTAGITGAQLSTTAGITGTQLSASAGITGTQLSATAAIVGTQLTGGTIGATQLAAGAVSPIKMSIFDHLIY